MSPDPAAADPPRWGRPGFDQATVLRRAIEVFNLQGYDATSMQDLARALGLAKSAIYHHVPSKSYLLQLALDEALAELTALVDRAATAGPETAGQRLRQTVREAVPVLIDHLPAVTLLLRVRGNSPTEVAALERRRAIDQRFADLVVAAIAEGSVRADLRPDLVSRLLFGLVNSLVEWYRPGGEIDAEEVADSVVSLAFDGLVPRR